VALEMREKGEQDNDLLARLAGDDRLRLDGAELAALVAEPVAFTGAAVAQVDAVVARVERLVDAFPEAAAYRPGAIL
jgi:adenylosuccinate lyase